MIKWQQQNKYFYIVNISNATDLDWDGKMFTNDDCNDIRYMLKYQPWIDFFLVASFYIHGIPEKNRIRLRFVSFRFCVEW